MNRKILLFFTTILFSMASTFAQGGTTGPLVWELNDGTLTISGEGEMPDYELDNKAPWYAYAQFINTVVIENGVKSIGNYAFYTSFLIYKFNSVTLPNSITNIGDYAFCLCTELSSIDLPNSLISIGTASFGYCTSLTSVIIPNSVIVIGSHAFFNCTSLISINVESENNVYASLNGVLFNKGKNILICCPAGKAGAYLIPSSVTNIGEFAFSDCSSLISVTLPNSITNIGKEAFSSCTNLTSITNLNSVPINISHLSVFVFINISECTLNVPVASILDYKNADIWKEFNIVGIEVGIETIVSDNVKIYPNPTTDELKIESGELKIENITIFDTYGRILKVESRKQNVEREILINISELPTGAYFLQITTDGGEVVRKVLKE